MDKIILDNDTLRRTIRRISYEIIEKNEDLKDVVLLGIMKKGVRLAQIIAANIKQIEGNDVYNFPLDISSYRDDINTAYIKNSNKSNIIVDLKDKTVIIVDDVLYTGRTIRAAMDAIIDLGRPEKIECAILIDRGHRQLPVHANYVGKNIPTSKSEKILVSLSDLKDDKVLLIK